MMTISAAEAWRTTEPRPPDAVDGHALLCDHDFRVIRADVATAHLLGCLPRDLVGRRLIDLIAPTHRPAMLRLAGPRRTTADTGAGTPCDLVSRHGERVGVELTIASATEYDGPHTAFVVDLVPTGTAQPAATDGTGGVSSGSESAARLAALASPELVRLLYTVTQSAHAADTLASAARDAIESLCLFFTWPSGALVMWGPDGRPQETVTIGDWGEGPLEALGERTPSLPLTREPRVIRRDGMPVVVVGITDDAAMLFAGTDVASAISEQVLSVVAGQCARVAERERADRAAPAPPVPPVPSQTSESPRGRHTRSASASRSESVDALTGLETRTQLAAALDAAAHGQALVLIDLDGFKSINDTYGHHIGDEALVMVADRLRAAVRPGDVVVRFGGDEFVVLCPSTHTAVTIAERVLRSLAEPFHTSAGVVRVTASVGISDGALGVASGAELLTRADAAMYAAKRSGKNTYRRYDDVLHAQVVADRRMEQVLRQAIPDDRLVVHYQPIVDSASLAIVGAEAVVRLIDDDGRLSLPADFLAVARRSGLMTNVDTWMVEEACRRIADVQRATGYSLSVSINISGRFLARPDFADTVLGAVTDSGLPAGDLMVEFSECDLMQAEPAALQQLARLRDGGVYIAVDNFGLDHTALQVLDRAPLSHVKVCRERVEGAAISEADRVMVEAITWLADQLGMSWIAQGVETDEQWQAVQRFAPTLAQGFFFERPLPEADLVAALRHGVLSGDAGYRPKHAIAQA